MRKYVLCALVLLLPLLSSCIDFGLHYLIREDGSLRVVYDLVLDKTLLQLLYTADAPKSDSNSHLVTPPPPPSGDSANASSGTEYPLGRPFKMTKEIADSIRNKIFGAEIERLRKEPGVLSATSKDSVAYDGVHFLFTTELRSYHDVSLLRSRDTTSKKQKFHLADSIYVAEHGDSVMFMIADLSSLEENSTFPDFPNPHTPVYKKTRMVLPQAPSSLIHRTLWSPSSSLERPRHEHQTPLHWFSKYSDALVESQKTGKNLLVYFTGYTTINCRQMEQTVLLRDDVRDLLDGYVLVKLYTDNGSKANDENMAMEDSLAHTTGLPYFVILTPNEEAKAHFPGFTRDPSEFISFLRLEAPYLDSNRMVATDSTMVGDSSYVDDSDQENPFGGGADSLMKGMETFASMLSGLMTIEMTIESPLIIGHGPSATYDPATHTATWQMDISSIAALKQKSAEELQYYVWLRKPKR